MNEHNNVLDYSYCLESLVTEALNFATSGPSGQSAKELLSDHNHPGGPWLRRINRPKKASKEGKEMSEGQKEYARAAAVTPDGRYAVTTSFYCVKVWKLDTGACLRTLKGHEDLHYVVMDTPIGTIRSLYSDNPSDEYNYVVAVTPDSNRVVVGSNQNIELWDIETGKCLKTMEGHTDEVGFLGVTPDGRRLVAGKYQKIMIWDMETGKCLKTIEEHRPWVENEFVRWKKPLRFLDGFIIKRKEHGFLSMVITPDSRFVISGNTDETVRVWNLETGECLKVLTGNKFDVMAVAVTPDGRRVLAGSYQKIMIWDMETGECLKTLDGHKHDVVTLGVTSDGRLAVSSSNDGTVKLWNLETGECIKTLEEDTMYVETAVAVANDRGVTVNRSDTITLWDLTKCEKVACFYGEDRMEEISACAIDPNGTRIAAEGNSGRIYLLALENAIQVPILTAWCPPFLMKILDLAAPSAALGQRSLPPLSVQKFHVPTAASMSGSTLSPSMRTGGQWRRCGAEGQTVHET